VNADLSVPGHPEIFVVGDLALVEQEGGAVPGLAPAAMQEGRHAARNIARALAGEPPAPFRYRDKGILATIGRAAAVARIGRVRLSGLPAWLAWLLVHIFFLIGFRNRVAVMLQWAWSFVTFKRGARLITETAAQWRKVAQERERLSIRPPPDERRAPPRDEGGRPVDPTVH
jgi:NADH dehydrogenase